MSATPDPIDPAPIAFVGIGNTLAGDDGAGIEVVNELERRAPAGAEALFIRLEGDLYEMADRLAQARRFIFIDAYLGDRPGEVLTCQVGRPCVQPSLHMTDIGAVMLQLRELRLVDPFPAWEIRGISVVPPFTLQEGLSPLVRKGVERMVDRLQADFFV